MDAEEGERVDELEGEDRRGVAEGADLGRREGVDPRLEVFVERSCVEEVVGGGVEQFLKEGGERGAELFVALRLGDEGIRQVCFLSRGGRSEQTPPENAV